MEITINKIFCLNLYENPLRDTWYSRKYAEPQKDRGQQPRFDHGRYTTWPTGYILHQPDTASWCMHVGIPDRMWLHRIVSVLLFCSQSERAKYICLKKSWISANQKGSLICLFPTFNTNLHVCHVTNRCISRKTETGNQKPYISKYN